MPMSGVVLLLVLFCNFLMNDFSKFDLWSVWSFRTKGKMTSLNVFDVILINFYYKLPPKELRNSFWLDFL